MKKNSFATLAVVAGMAAAAELTKLTPLAGHKIDHRVECSEEKINRKKQRAVVKAQKQVARLKDRSGQREKSRYMRQFKEFEKVQARNVALGKWA